MKRKRLLAFFMAASVAAGLLTGCGSSAADSGSDASASAESSESSDTADADETSQDEYPDIEMWSTNIGYLPVEKDGTMYNFYKELIGVGITQPYVEWNGGTTYYEQLNLRIAAGDMPDIVQIGDGVEVDLIKQGALLDLTDLLPEYAPHLWESVPQETWEAIKAADPTGEGRIYYTPTLCNYVRHSGLIRQDWLDALGLDMPTTQEEFVNVLRAFKNDDPNGNGIADEIPTGGRAEARWMDYLFAMYGVAMWEGYPQWDLYDGEITYSAVTQNMRDALEFISGLYAEGLLDEESLLNDKAAWDGKVNTGNVGVFYQWEEQTYNYALNIENATGVQADWSVLPVIQVEGYEGFITEKPTVGAAFAINAADDEEHIKACLRVLDFYGDPDMSLTLTLGPEGMYHTTDADGNVTLLPADLTTQENMVIKPNDSLVDADKVIEVLDLIRTDDNAWAVEKSISNVEEAQQYGKVIAGDGLPSAVYDGYEDINNRTLYVEYASKIITGEWPIEKFDEFVEKWYATGGTEVTQNVRDWYASK